MIVTSGLQGDAPGGGRAIDDCSGRTREAERDEVVDVVGRATEAVGRRGRRASLVVEADIRPGRTGELDGEVARLEQALGEQGRA